MLIEHQTSMARDLKSRVKTLFLDSPLGDLWRRLKANHEMKAWEMAGRPVPPPHLLKQQTLLAYASAFHAETLVETGTYLGDMVYAMKDRFLRIVSVELDDTFYKQARRRFRPYSHIEIRHGDSGEELAEILSTVSSRCLFWLDGHYSAGLTAKGKTDTPVLQEVQLIFRHTVKDHVILIDDARCFGGTRDYPTLETLHDFVERNAPHHELTVQCDVIRIHPRRDSRLIDF